MDTATVTATPAFTSRLPELAPFAATARRRGTWSATTAAALMGGLFAHGQDAVDLRNGIDPDAEPRPSRKSRAAKVAVPVSVALVRFDVEAPRPGTSAAPQWTAETSLTAPTRLSSATSVQADVGIIDDPRLDLVPLLDSVDTDALSDDEPDADSSEAREAQATDESALEAALVAATPARAPEPEIVQVRPSRFAATGKRGQRLGEGEIALADARERLAQLKAAPYATEHLVGLWSAKVAELEART